MSKLEHCSCARILTPTRGSKYADASCGVDLYAQFGVQQLGLLNAQVRMERKNLQLVENTYYSTEGGVFVLQWWPLRFRNPCLWTNWVTPIRSLMPVHVAGVLSAIFGSLRSSWRCGSCCSLRTSFVRYVRSPCRYYIRPWAHMGIRKLTTEHDGYSQMEPEACDGCCWMTPSAICKDMQSFCTVFIIMALLIEQLKILYGRVLSFDVFASTSETYASKLAGQYLDSMHAPFDRCTLQAKLHPFLHVRLFKVRCTVLNKNMTSWRSPDLTCPLSNYPISNAHFSRICFCLSQATIHNMTGSKSIVKDAQSEHRCKIWIYKSVQ